MGLISDLFGTNDDGNDVDELIAALQPPREELELTARFGEPHYSDHKVPTAVLPYDLYDDGEHYGMGNKEFEIANGFDEATGLKTVLSRLTDTDDPTPETLAEIEGKTCSASLDYEGDLQLFSNDEAE